MSVTVKICGITSAADAQAVADAGADFVGFVFFPFSPRCLAPEACTWIRHTNGARRVGVFRDQSVSFISRIRDEARLDIVQLHGDEPPELCQQLGGAECVIKAVPVGETLDWRSVEPYLGVARILFDTAGAGGGGTGRTFNWRLLAVTPVPLQYWLAGGLRAGNVGHAIATARPAGVDVATGVEVSLGRKDPERVREFVDAVRRASQPDWGSDEERVRRAGR